MKLKSASKPTPPMRLASLEATLRWVGLLFTVLLMILTLAVANADAAGNKTSKKGRAKFDHNKTGFVLQGEHARVNCESCHAKGVFKGTPKDCGGCHSQGSRINATAKSSQHIVTNEKCESCHQVTGWAEAKMSHASIAPGSCSNCHNNSKMAGKPAHHIKNIRFL